MKLTKLFVFVLTCGASVAFGSSVSFADPKQQIKDVEGEYIVSKVESADEDFCVDKAGYTVKWFESRHGLALSVGEGILIFNRLNAGPSSEVESEDGQNCRVQTDTQTEAGRLTSNVFTKCPKETTTELTVLKFSKGLIEYKKELKIPRKGKTVVVTSACTLKKK